MPIKLTPKKGSPLDPRGLRDLERAVIEAARVYVHGYRKPYQASTGHAHQALMKAIEALEAAEKGE